jgi:hypothetical protein
MVDVVSFPSQPKEPPMHNPTLTPRRRRRPIFAGVLGVLLVGGVLAATLISGARGSSASAIDGQDEAALQLAVADAGGLGDLADGSTAPGATPAAFGAPGGQARPPLGRLGDNTLLVGTVAAAGGGKLTVTRDGGGDITVTTTDKTKVRGTGKKVVGDLAAGERVVVRVGTDKSAVGVLVLRPHVAGTVTKLDGDRASVTRASGLTQVVDVSGLTEKPKVGDLIAVVGSATDNGTTIKAEKIKQLPKTS